MSAFMQELDLNGTITMAMDPRQLLEDRLIDTNDSAWKVKDLRHNISAMRDLDFPGDNREKIPEKWSTRPVYLPHNVDFFDPQNGKRLEGSTTRGPKPSKSRLLPLFQKMRDHHFPNLCSMSCATQQLDHFNLRARDSASRQARAGLMGDISLPAIPTVVQDLEDFNDDLWNSDKFLEKPSPSLSVTQDMKPPAPALIPNFPVFTDEITVELDDDHVQTMNPDDLVNYFTAGSMDLCPTIPVVNIDAVSNEERGFDQLCSLLEENVLGSPENMEVAMEEVVTSDNVLALDSNFTMMVPVNIANECMEMVNPPEIFFPQSFLNDLFII